MSYLALGPKNCFCTIQRRIFGWKEKLCISLGRETQANSRGSSEAFFRSKQKWWKVWISAASKPRPSIACQTSYTSWNHSHGSTREQILSRYWENYPRKWYFFCYFYALFYNCIFPRQEDRSRSVYFLLVETSLSMHVWISFEYMLWFNFIFGLNFITLFWGIEMYDN